MKYFALSDQTIALSVKVARATMGIDALYNAEKGDEDDLVVLNMANVQPEPFGSYDAALDYLADLARETMTLPEADRRLYYAQACTSLASFCRWRKGQLEAMSDQIALFLHVDPTPATQRDLDALNDKLYGMLGELGYTGDLKERIAKWEQKNLVPPDEVQGTMTEMMAQARELTGQFLPLPEGDYYHCRTVSDGHFNASSHYDERCVVINVSPILTTQKLRHLVCHEVYPGHFMQFTLRRQAWEKGVGGLDGTLSVCNHSSSCTFEGIADCGLKFLGWDNTLDDKVSELIAQIQGALATAASYRLHTLKWEAGAVESFLRANAPGGGEGWIANRMAFISDPARAALIWSYMRGDEGTMPVWERAGKADRERFFEYIYGRLHTVQSLQLFR